MSKRTSSRRERTQSAVVSVGFGVLALGGLCGFAGAVLWLLGLSAASLFLAVGATATGLGVLIVFSALIALGQKEAYTEAREEVIEIGTVAFPSGTVVVCEPTNPEWQDQRFDVPIPAGEYRVTLHRSRYDEDAADITAVVLTRGGTGTSPSSEPLEPIFELGHMVIVDSALTKDPKRLQEQVAQAVDAAEEADGWFFLRDSGGRAYGILALVTGEEEYEMAVSRGQDITVLRCGLALPGSIKKEPQERPKG